MGPLCKGSSELPVHGSAAAWGSRAPLLPRRGLLDSGRTNRGVNPGLEISPGLQKCMGARKSSGVHIGVEAPGNGFRPWLTLQLPPSFGVWRRQRWERLGPFIFYPELLSHLPTGSLLLSSSPWARPALSFPLDRLRSSGTSAHSHLTNFLSFSASQTLGAPRSGFTRLILPQKKPKSPECPYPHPNSPLPSCPRVALESILYSSIFMRGVSAQAYSN